jgi:hypothetical protein
MGSPLQNAKTRDVDMSGKDFPKNCCPFETNIAYVESIENPCPLRIIEMKINVNPSCFSVANIASIKIREHVEAADNR